MPHVQPALLYFGISVSVTLYPDFGYIFKEKLDCHGAYQEAYNSIIAYLYFCMHDKFFLKAEAINKEHERETFVPLYGTSGHIFSITATEEGVACTFSGSYVQHGLLTNLITPPFIR